MNIVKNRNKFFVLSAVIITLGIVAIFAFGLKYGIDFTGGTVWEIKLPAADAAVQKQDIEKVVTEKGITISSIAETSQDSFLLRLKQTDEEKIKETRQSLNESFGEIEELRLETVGPTISQELKRKAIIAIVLSLVAIVAYVTWAFRKVPKPTSSVAFGVCTIIALLHDIVVTVGVFAILGYFLNLEVDLLIVTALLTVLGFSVHDTIVVFDRVRENITKHRKFSFESVVNHSLLQTMSRSLNTSLTVVFVLSALLLFGGESLVAFTLTLLIGIISGTYSSIFIASPLLVVWNNFKKPKRVL